MGKTEIVIDIKANTEAVRKAFRELNDLEINPKISSDDILGEFNKIIDNLEKLSPELNLDLNFDQEELESIAREFEELFGNFSDSDIELFNNEMLKSASGELSKLSEMAKKAKVELGKSGSIGSQEFDKLEKEIKETQEALEEATKEATNFGENLQKASDSKGFAERMAGFGLMANGLQTAIGATADLSRNFVELDSATYKVRSLGEEAQKIAPDLKAMSLAMSSEMAISATDIQTASYEALSAGIKATKEDMEAFMGAAAKLAVGGNETINNTVNLLSSMINAYGESASKTEEYSNILSMTANLGKTSIAEMSQSMSNVIPTAAAMGFKLESVGASLALMTANGIPTAQATTKLNQLLLEIQKPGKEFADVMKKGGTSVEEIGEKIRSGDVLGAFKDLDDAIKKSGVKAVDVFSSDVALSGFQTLTKDLGKFEEMLIGVGESAGATESAYGEMSQSIENRTKVLQNKFDNLVTSTLESSGAFGTLAVVGAQTAEKLSPAISSIAGMKELFGGLGKTAFDVGNKILSKLIPAVFAQAGATTAATGAQTGLNVAMNANPAGAIILAITAIIGLLYIFIEKTDEGKELWQEVKNTFESVKNTLMPIFDSLIEYTKAYIGYIVQLGKFLFQWFITPFQIGIKVLTKIISLFTGSSNEANGTKTAVKGVAGAIDIVTKAVKTVTGFIEAATTKFTEAKQVMFNFIEAAPALLGALLDLAKYHLDPSNWFGDDEEAKRKIDQRISMLMNRILDGKKAFNSVPLNPNYDPNYGRATNKPEGEAPKDPPAVVLDQNKKITKEKESQLEIAKKQLALEEQRLDREQEIYRQNILNKAISENRELSEAEQLEISKSELKLLEDKRKLLVDIFQKNSTGIRGLKQLVKSINENGEIEINKSVKLKPIEEEELRKIFSDANKALSDKKYSLIPRIDIEKMQAELAASQLALDKQKLEVKIESNTAEVEDVLSVYSSLIDGLKAKIASLRQTAEDATNEGERLKAMKDLNNASLELINIEKEQSGAINKIREQKIATLKKAQEAESEELRKQSEKLKKHYDSISELIAEGVKKSNDKKRDFALDELDAKHKRELARIGDNDRAKELAERNHRKRKEAIEREFSERQLLFEKQMAQERLAVEEVFSAEKLKEERDQLLEQKRLNEELGNTKEAEAIGEKIDAINKEIAKKGDITEKSMELLGNTINEGLAAAIGDGGTEALKGVLKKNLSAMAGYLKGLLKTWVIENVLKSPMVKTFVAANPLLGAGITAGIMGTLSAGMDALITPMLSGLLSFPTGGAVTSPTIFKAGDASVQGGDNTEWIFRNDQLKRVLSDVLYFQTEKMSRSIREELSSVFPQRLETKISGRDLLIILERERVSESYRTRT